ncbi:C40 family peptidase [Paenibacillus sp. GCM10023248]|uniref:C40 family peptidase n=1 Tax=Bacillales TaxID=1385 RepID=UPI002377F6D7|nr:MULTISPECIES: C40 family peptidase [Bacillales]MDD9270866.1 C40 family peptidase [Paenibacillus sp. MAHUQ-63]MDR6882999.1 cell wall-associated NlpC family hydrolase [Bacillus sp. 3255]
MIKHLAKRTLGITAAVTIALSATTAVSAYAANDDMDAVSLAKKLVGIDYSRSNETPSAGFDSSGLIYYVYQTLDYSVPRTLAEQFKMNKKSINDISKAEPGDILFFGSGKTPSYAGIYVGQGKMVMSSQSRDEVVTRNVNDYKKSFIGGKSILSATDRLKAELILAAQKYLGVPYEFGAKYGQTKTMDCSSFVKTVFAQYDITLPRVSRNQAKEGKYVSKSNLEAGDLVFFTTPDSGKSIGHVGIYVGNGNMIHTYGEGGVKFTSINKEWWADHYVTARRILD